MPRILARSGFEHAQSLTLLKRAAFKAVNADDRVGWVQTGRKRWVTPAGALQFGAGQVFLIPQQTQWDRITAFEACGLANFS